MTAAPDPDAERTTQLLHGEGFIVYETRDRRPRLGPGRARRLRRLRQRRGPRAGAGAGPAGHRALVAGLCPARRAVAGAGRAAVPGRGPGQGHHRRLLPAARRRLRAAAASGAVRRGPRGAGGALHRRALPLGRAQHPRHRLLGAGAAGADRRRPAGAARFRHAGGAARRRRSRRTRRCARGDLVFWRGHVGIMRDPETLLHANGHHMAVATEPLASASRGSPAQAAGRSWRAGGPEAATARCAAPCRASGRGRSIPASPARQSARSARTISAAISTASSRAPSAASATKRAKTHSSAPAQGQSSAWPSSGRRAWPHRQPHQLGEVGDRAPRPPSAPWRAASSRRSRSAPSGPVAPEPQAADHLPLDRRQLGQPADRRGAGVPRLGAHLVRISLPCRVMRSR